MTVLITGGAGFIGCNFILDWLAQSDERIVNLDALTYAGNPENLSSVAANDRYVFVKGDIGDLELVSTLLDNRDWVANMTSGAYRSWVKWHYGD